jgi:hypothetical protein
MSSLSSNPVVVVTTMMIGPATDALERSSKRRRISHTEAEAKKAAFELDAMFQHLQDDDDGDAHVFPSINWDFNDNDDDNNGIKKRPSRRCSDPEAVQLELLKGGASSILPHHEEEELVLLRSIITSPRSVPLKRSHRSCGALSPLIQQSLLLNKKPIDGAACSSRRGGMVRSKAFSYPLFGLLDDASSTTNMMMMRRGHHHHPPSGKEEEEEPRKTELSTLPTSSRRRITPQSSKIDAASGSSSSCSSSRLFDHNLVLLQNVALIDNHF